MGDRVLQIGIDDPAIASTLASKVGLSGHAAIAVVDDASAARAQSAAANAGILVDVKVAPPDTLPYDSDAFDLVIVHSLRGHLFEANRASRRLARHVERYLKTSA